MNFYKHHIGDYASSTAHLSVIEHGAYLLMLHHHYATEQPLPLDVGTIARIIRASSKAELDAIKRVLCQFWTQTEAGWVQARAQHEIQSASEVRDLNREKGKLGGRPRKTQSDNRTEPNENPPGFSRLNRTEPNENPSQTPDSRHQTKPVVLASEPLPQSPPTPAGEICSRLRALGVQGVNPSHPKLLALLDAGLQGNELVMLAAEPRAQGKGFAWLLATSEGRRRDAAKVRPLPAAKPTIEDLNRVVAEQWRPPELRGATA